MTTLQKNHLDTSAALTQAIKGTASTKAGSSGWVFTDNSAAALI